MDLKVEKITLPKDCNVIIGSAHFIKTVEDLHETLVESSPALKFGIGFNEASGPCLVRSSGNDAELINAAEKTSLQIGAGHVFVIYLRDGYPINVLNRIKNVSEVCTIHCASANPVEVLLVETAQGRGVVGVVDGSAPKGIETETDKQNRHDLLRKIGYKI